MTILTSIASWTSHNLHLFLYLVETEETLRWQSIALLRKFSGLVSDRNLICRVTASRFLSSSDNFSNILYNTILRSKNSKYWLLIGQYWSRDLNTGLWLVKIVSKLYQSDSSQGELEGGRLRWKSPSPNQKSQPQIPKSLTLCCH